MSVTEVCEIVVAVPVGLGLLAGFFHLTFKVGDLLRKVNIVVKEVTPNSGKSMKDQLARNTKITKRIRLQQQIQHQENTLEIAKLKETHARFEEGQKKLERGQEAVLLEQERVRKELAGFQARWAVPVERKEA
jgi:hypothetical protein